MKWYEEDVELAIAERSTRNYEPKTIFYGSSTIRLWDSLYEDFKEMQPVNLGFGGSTLAACVWFFDRIIAPLKQPTSIILYGGDNDLGDGRKPEEVYIFFSHFLTKLRERFDNIPLYFISIKPSLKRMDIIDQIKYANQLIKGEIDRRNGQEYFINVFDAMIGEDGQPIKELFVEDGLHLDKKGYDIWRQTIQNSLPKA